ncbi:MAG: hypothetical protein MJ152_01855, partial [Clostridia bacterium]|nr:hypothetical protein [Clostridia bacterium]
MKKFLIFLVSIIVVVTLGLTTYYFLRNEEVIDFTVKEIYCNQGDIVTLAELGKVVKKENLTNKTVYDYNAGGEAVTTMFEYKEEQGYYIAKAGGNPIVVITTTNARCPEFKIAVHIGDGTGDTPYFVGSQADLMKIGNVEGYGLNGNYSLSSDIVLSEDFKPIGYNASTGTVAPFTGTFEGNGHTISGLKVTNEEEPVTRKVLRAETPSTGLVDAGLFAKLNDDAKILNLKLDDVTISGAFETAGALAGKAAGTIRNVTVTNANITNTKNGGYTGGLFGSFSNATSVLSVASVDTTTITIGKDTTTISEGTCVGGLIGKLDRAKVQATFAKATIKSINDAENKACAGGLVGEFGISATTGTIQESYAICATENANCGAFIGKISKQGEGFDQCNVLKYLVGNYCVASERDAILSMPEDIFKSEYFVRDDVFLVNSTAETEADLKLNNAYYYYSVGLDKHLWDSSVWSIEASSLPQLKFNKVALEEVSQAYYLKDLNDNPIADEQAFLKIISDAIKDNNGVLTGSYTIYGDVDLTEYGVWTPVALKDCVINFNGHKIKNLTLGSHDADGNMGLFTTMENSVVMNLTLEGVAITSNATNVGAVVGTVKKTSESSAILNVDVTYSANITDKTMTYYGGLVGYADSLTMENCSVSGINTINSTIDYAGGVVGKLASGNIAGVKVDITNISATKDVAGVVAVNAGTVKAYSYTTDSQSGVVHNGGKVVITCETSNATKIGGMVAENSGSILDGSFEIEISVKSTYNAEIKTYTLSGNSTNLLNIEELNTVKVGGVAGINTGNIENVTINGAGVKVLEANGNSMVIGGIVATNQGAIKYCACNVTKLGEYFANATHYVVGGIAGTNSTANASIYQCSVSADISGNYVSGVVVSMNNTNASANEVFVGKLTKGEEITITENVITGDKYVAGICYNFNAGKMADIQT